MNGNAIDSGEAQIISLETRRDIAFQGANLEDEPPSRSAFEKSADVFPEMEITAQQKV